MNVNLDSWSASQGQNGIYFNRFLSLDRVAGKTTGVKSIANALKDYHFFKYDAKHLCLRLII